MTGELSDGYDAHLGSDLILMTPVPFMGAWTDLSAKHFIERSLNVCRSNALSCSETKALGRLLQDAEKRLELERFIKQQTSGPKPVSAVMQSFVSSVRGILDIHDSLLRSLLMTGAVGLGSKDRQRIPKSGPNSRLAHLTLPDLVFSTSTLSRQLHQLRSLCLGLPMDVSDSGLLGKLFFGM